MSNGPSCPQCRTTVEAHWDWCHACGFDPEGLMPADLRAEGRVPVAAGSAGPPIPPVIPPPNPGVIYGSSPGGPPPGAPAAAPTWNDSWAGAPKPKSRKTRSVVSSLLIVFGGLVILAIAAFFLAGPKLVKTIASTKSGAGAKDPVAYTAPDGSYSVSLSGTPKSQDKPQTDGTVLHIWGWDGGPNGQFVFWGELPAEYDPSMEQRVLDATRGGVSGKGITTQTTFAGHAAIKYTGTFDDIDGQGYMFIDHGRLYILMAGGPWASQDPQAAAFLNSFALTPAS